MLSAGLQRSLCGSAALKVDLQPHLEFTLILRGSDLPKVALPRVRPTPWNKGVLKRLNASAQNSTCLDSVIRNLFCIAKSTFAMPGSTIVPTPALPKVFGD